MVSSSSINGARPEIDSMANSTMTGNAFVLCMGQKGISDKNMFYFIKCNCASVFKGEVIIKLLRINAFFFFEVEIFSI